MKHFTIIFLVISFLACSQDDSEMPSVNFSLVAQGSLFGDGDEGISKSNLVINNTNSWNDLIDQMDSVNMVSDEFGETQIDFERFLLIAVFDQVYPNGGHSIDITNINENEDSIFVKIENLNSGDDTQIVTQPFHIIKINITDKEINFSL